MGRLLSKSRFQKGLQCEKALWLAANRRDLAAPVGAGQQWIFDQGHEVGRLAQALFPGGAEITEDHLHPAEALERTHESIALGARVLYEAAFVHEDAFCRADIVVATGDGAWDLYEVKSSTSVKKEHITDAGFQAAVMEGAGFPVRSVGIVHVNTRYTYSGGPVDPQAILTVTDVTLPVRSFMPEVSGTAARLRSIMEGPEPRALIGSRCASPHTCEFRAYCHEFLPRDTPITALPRFSDSLLHAALEAGITSCADLPLDFPGLSAVQREAIEVALAGKPSIDTEGLQADLAALVWPVMHLDFETAAPAIPLWPGTRPYQTIPFQYSVHVEQADGSVEHRAYLHEGSDDPRPELTERLIADLQDGGSVVHYTSYERTQLAALADALPDREDALGRIRERLFDLEPVIRRRTRHPRALGRSSIKYTLPAWCPDLSYDGLEIADGQTASACYLRMVTGRADQAEQAATTTALMDYCGLDTYAMVRLLDRMVALTSEGDRSGPPMHAEGNAHDG